MACFHPLPSHHLPGATCAVLGPHSHPHIPPQRPSPTATTPSLTHTLTPQHRDHLPLPPPLPNKHARRRQAAGPGPAAPPTFRPRPEPGGEAQEGRHGRQGPSHPRDQEEDEERPGAGEAGAAEARERAAPPRAAPRRAHDAPVLGHLVREVGALPPAHRHGRSRAGVQAVQVLGVLTSFLLTYTILGVLWWVCLLPFSSHTPYTHPHAV